jgi:serine/threonine protein kinase
MKHAAFPIAVRTDIAPGDTFGPYRVIGKIAGGGYRAACPARSRSSLYRLDVADLDGWREASVRMMRAARVVESLHHPGIARIAEHGVASTPAGNRAWQATEVPASVALYDVVARRQMPAFEVAALVRDLADVLAYAHARGVVHGGLAMRAIVIPTGERDYSVCVVEWGQPPRDLGVYGAPEGGASAAADVYALGVIAYRAAAGRFPITPIDDVPRAPAALTELIARMRAASPDARPTAAEVRALAAEIANAVAREPAEPAAALDDDDETIELDLELEALIDDSVIEVVVPRAPRWTPPIPMRTHTPAGGSFAVSGEIEKS